MAGKILRFDRKAVARETAGKSEPKGELVIFFEGNDAKAVFRLEKDFIRRNPGGELKLLRGVRLLQKALRSELQEALLRTKTNNPAS